MIDLEKRKRIMQRSIALGHCICNPREPCPCELLRTRNVCHCAGERIEDAPEVLLTSLVENAGCASKISQDDLRRVLADLPPVTDPRVLVGTGTCDDAGVFLLTDDTALVQSVDVFTPAVDDPYVAGQIAAANSLSDIYAMGGTPLTALAIVAFPIDQVSPRVLTEMLRGGLDKMAEANAAVVGGHSLKDPEPKFGFAVTGVVSPHRIVTNAGARPGQVLILTKPLGTGVLAFAQRLGRAPAGAMEAAAQSMATLNRKAAEVMLAHGVDTATDVTGFGLLGHLGELARQSQVTVEVEVSRVPVLPGVWEALAAGLISGAAERNREHASAWLTAAPGVTEEQLYLLCDPQTSGGLLMAVDETQSEALLSALRDQGVPAVAIGQVLEASAGRIIVRGDEGLTEESAFTEEEPSCCCCCCEENEDEEASDSLSPSRRGGRGVRQGGAGGEAGG